MADARIEELRRRAAGGDLDARARLLKEELRAGRLAPERLEAAALLGDAGARAALDLPPLANEPLPGAVEELDAVLAALVGLAAARHVLEAALDPMAPAAVAALAAWVACPCTAHQESLGARAGDMVRATWAVDLPTRTAGAGRSLAATRALRAIAWASKLGEGATPANARCAVAEALAAVGPAGLEPLRAALVDALLVR